MKKLERTRRDNVLAGVCGGLAKFFNIDVMVVRGIWILAAIFDGPGLFVYIICAIIIPKEKLDEAYYREEAYDPQKEERSKNYFGFGLIAIGVYMAVNKFLPDISMKFMWPVLLIAAGILLLSRDKN